jgi:hypothetical protein
MLHGTAALSLAMLHGTSLVRLSKIAPTSCAGIEGYDASRDADDDTNLPIRLAAVTVTASQWGLIQQNMKHKKMA